MSVSLLGLGEDSSWTGHTAVPGRCAPDTAASNKTTCAFVSVLIFVLLELTPFALTSNYQYVRVSEQICMSRLEWPLSFPHWVMRDSIL